jgi:hypothetical protein
MSVLYVQHCNRVIELQGVKKRAEVPKAREVVRENLFRTKMVQGLHCHVGVTTEVRIGTVLTFFGTTPPVSAPQQQLNQ